MEDGGVGDLAAVIDEHPDRGERSEDEQHSPAPVGVGVRAQEHQQHRHREGDARLCPRGHREDQPAHEPAPSGPGPFHGQRDRGGVLPRHEDPAEEPQHQDQGDRPGAEDLMGGHRGDQQRAGRGAGDRDAGGAGAPQPVRDAPEHDPADGPPEQHRHDDQGAGRGGRRGPGEHHHRRGEGGQRQEHMDVVHPVADHSGAQGGTALRWEVLIGGPVARVRGSRQDLCPAHSAPSRTVSRWSAATGDARRSAWSKNSSSCRHARR